MARNNYCNFHYYPHNKNCDTGSIIQGAAQGLYSRIMQYDVHRRSR